jgi:hypothetical protein
MANSRPPNHSFGPGGEIAQNPSTDGTLGSLERQVIHLLSLFFFTTIKNKPTNFTCSVFREKWKRHTTHGE